MDKDAYMNTIASMSDEDRANLYSLNLRLAYNIMSACPKAHERVGVFIKYYEMEELLNGK